MLFGLFDERDTQIKMFAIQTCGVDTERCSSSDLIRIGGVWSVGSETTTNVGLRSWVVFGSVIDKLVLTDGRTL